MLWLSSKPKEAALSLTQSLTVTDATIVATILHRWGHFKNLQSAKIQAKKYLDEHTFLRRLERVAAHARYSYYRIPGSRAEFSGHPKKITSSLANILSVNPAAIIRREVHVPEIYTRPDALVFMKQNGRGRCFVLEVKDHETDQYLANKVNKWRLWKDALSYLSHTFGTKIPCFDFVVDGETNVPGVIQFQDYLKEIQNESDSLVHVDRVCHGSNKA